MTCAELIQYLSDYIDQDLNEELTREAQEHLTTCRNCRVVLNTTQKTILLYKQTGRQTIPAERRATLFARLQAALSRDATGRDHVPTS
ncbi:MAG: zf-HC2 domain-containing protein [Anaerolineales bacterium]|nr:zf-HC2 domain-containing protein [Anaerolineales bacterium]